MADILKDRRRQGLLTEETDGGTAQKTGQTNTAARMRSLYQGQGESGAARESFRQRSESMQAANKRLNEIAFARRDAEANPTQFHNIRQQKDFLAYLDEEEAAANTRKDTLFSEGVHILQKEYQRSEEMRYNRRILEQELAESLGRAARKAPAAEAARPIATAAKPIAEAARPTAALPPIVKPVAQRGVWRGTGKEDAWDKIKGIFGGNNKPAATPAPTATPEPAIAVFELAEDAERGQSVHNPKAVRTSHFAKNDPLLRNRKMTDTGGGMDGRDKAREATWTDKVARSSSKPLVEDAMGERLAFKAQSFEGVPYKWAGKDAKGGLDCSGLVTLCCELIGSPLIFDEGHVGKGSAGMASSMEITKYGTSVWDHKSNVPLEYDQLKPGDLIFSGGDSGKITHVAIYIGDGRTIEATDVSGIHKVTDRKVYELVDKYGSYIRESGQTVLAIRRPNHNQP